MKLSHLKLIQYVNILLFLVVAYMYSTRREILLSPSIGSTALGSWLLGGFLVFLLIIIVVISFVLYFISRQSNN